MSCAHSTEVPRSINRRLICSLSSSTAEYFNYWVKGIFFFLRFSEIKKSAHTKVKASIKVLRRFWFCVLVICGLVTIKFISETWRPEDKCMFAFHVSKFRLFHTSSGCFRGPGVNQ